MPRNSRVTLIVVMLLAVSALLLLWLGWKTDIDIRLATAMYDTTAAGFPWRHTWLAERLAHIWVKRIMLVAGVVVALFCVVDLWRPVLWMSAATRVRVRIVALCAATIPLAVSVLKRLSASHCPWDIDQFGGTAPYVRLLEAMPAHVSAGHCFPAGHATSVLWLVSLCVFWLPAQPRRAMLVALLALLAGGGVGWVQQLRGAHFLSHTLWSMWIACAVTTVWYVVLSRRERSALHEHQRMHV